MMEHDPQFDQFARRDKQPVSGLSMTSMILGIVSFPAVCCGLLGIPIPIAAVICGHLGIKDVNDNSEKTGKAFAVAGLIMGYLVIFLTVAFYLWVTSMDPEEMENLMKPILEKFEGMGGPQLQPPEIEVSELPEPVFPESE